MRTQIAITCFSASGMVMKSKFDEKRSVDIACEEKWAALAWIMRSARWHCFVGGHGVRLPMVDIVKRLNAGRSNFQ